MNCKPNDLAIVAPGGNRVHVGRPNGGRVFVVLRIASEADFPIPVKAGIFDRTGPVWVIEGDTYSWMDDAGEVVELALAPDRRLRPLRDQPGADETLTWAGMPEVATA